MISDEYLSKLKDILIKNNENVSNLEMTSGNYDDESNLIKEDIPTLITKFCEIGIHEDNIYFFYIIQSNSYTKKLFESLEDFPNIQFYGFKDFKNNLYPKKSFDYQEFEEEIKKDEYLQIQLGYNINKILPESLFKKYTKIKDVLNKNKVKVINQINKKPCQTKKQEN